MNLIRPILTEKTYRLAQEKNQYTFEVDRVANKKQVKKSVEDKFDVKVEDVKMLNMLGKVKTFGARRTRARRSSYKKAVVKLDKKDSIELFEMK